MAVQTTRRTTIYGFPGANLQLPPPIIEQARDPINGQDQGYPWQQWFNTLSLALFVSTGDTNWALMESSGSVGIFSSLTVTPGPISLTGQFTLTAGTNTVSIGADAADHSVNIGSSTGVSAMVIASGSGGTTLTTNAGAFAIQTSNGTITLNPGSGITSIASNLNASTINIGVAAAIIKTISIGGTGANVIAIGNSQTAGSISIGSAMTSSSISIGNNAGTTSLALKAGSGGIGLTGNTGVTGTLAATSTFIANSSTAVTAGGAIAITVGGGVTAPQILAGSGAPSLTAQKGSLYLRTDGSSTSTRAYIATDAAGTWTPITTLA